MKHSLAIISLAALLTACNVDTTGLSEELSNIPHPDSNANAVVTVTEYADLQCPACRAAHESIVGPVVALYGSQIRYEFKHFPLVSIHQYAMPAAEAAECSADQGKFWEFVDHAYEHQPELSQDALTLWGAELGLDTELYARCRDSHIKRGAIQDSYDEGRDMGVNGTPTFFVNGVRVDSSAAALGEAIEDALGGAGMNL